MPPLQLPPDLPLGAWSFALWISVHGILFYLFRLLGDPQGELRERAENETVAQLPALNEYLWRLAIESEHPYEGALRSASDLTNLLNRFRKAHRLVAKHNSLRRSVQFGYLSGAGAILGALVCFGVYMLQHPESEWANLASIVVFSIFTIISFWHLGKVAYYNIMIGRLSDED